MVKINSIGEMKLRREIEFAKLMATVEKFGESGFEMTDVRGIAYTITLVNGQLHAERTARVRSSAAIERDLPIGYSASGSSGKTCSCGHKNCDGNSPYCD